MDFPLTTLFHMQKALDEHIVSNKNLQGQDLFKKKIIALIVELGECANEMPEMFKFWSEKKNNHEKALEEYVDGLHFILSLGIDVKADDLEINKTDIHQSKKEDITSQFLILLQAIKEFDIQKKKVWFVIVCKLFIAFGEMIGFTWEEIVQAYIKKNEVNHNRQNSGY